MSLVLLYRVPCSEERRTWGLTVCIFSRFFIILSLRFVSEVQWDKEACTRVLENELNHLSRVLENELKHLSASHLLPTSPSVGSHHPLSCSLPGARDTVPPLNSHTATTEASILASRGGVGFSTCSSGVLGWGMAATNPTATWSPTSIHQVTLLGRVSCPPLMQVLIESLQRGCSALGNHLSSVGWPEGPWEGRMPGPISYPPADSWQPVGREWVPEHREEPSDISESLWLPTTCL